MSRDAPRLFNVPNLLSAIRLVGAWVVVALTFAGGERFLLPLVVVLLLTDWFDGKLAILLRQQTTFGARLDSLADGLFYAAVLLALIWLRTEAVVREVAWMVPATVAYAASCLAGWIKFGQIPTYHTRGAKIGWLVASVTILAVLATSASWPLRVAGGWTLLVNLEALAITAVLPDPAVNVPSLMHAWQRRSVAADRSSKEL